RLEDRQREAAFNAAFAQLQARLPRIKKNGFIEYPPNPDAKTPAGRKGSKTAYARWEDIMEAILPIVHEEGFALTYDAPPAADGRISCKATLIHREGHSRSSTFGPMPLDTSGGKNNLQAAGSTDSYGKRFATRDLLNLVYEGEDDDGVKGGHVPITPEQLQNLTALLPRAGVSVDEFCRRFRIETLADLPHADFTDAMNRLSDRAKRREGDAR
ncbi:MAG TPA: ERF family protein, partial [Stellaceae bacterium]|nr:ERF family protein [Stellaceae bacterium]